MKENAKAVPSKEAFVASMKDAKPEAVTGKDWADATSSIWDKAHQGQKESTPSKAKKLQSTSWTTVQGKRQRDQSGGSPQASSIPRKTAPLTTDTSGAEHHRLLVGDPATGWGQVRPYRICDKRQHPAYHQRCSRKKRI